MQYIGARAHCKISTSLRIRDIVGTYLASYSTKREVEI